MRIWLQEPHAGQLWIRRLWSSAQLTPPRPVGSGATCVLLSHSLHCSVYTPLFFSWSRLSVPENQFCLLHLYFSPSSLYSGHAVVSSCRLVHRGADHAWPTGRKGAVAGLYKKTVTFISRWYSLLLWMRLN